MSLSTYSSTFAKWLAALVAVGLLAIPAPDAAAQSASEFRQPPLDAKPHTWWHWMNGHVTREGITADLEAMKDVGLGGATLFNIGLLRTMPGPVEFMSEEWWSLVDHAMGEAERLGLEMAIHNADGWSQSGGPWIEPEESMMRVVWSETRVDGPGRIEKDLRQPLEQEGFYRDIAVIAFPSAQETRSPEISGVDGSVLTDGDLDTEVVLSEKNHGAAPFYIDISYEEPTTLRSLTLMLNHVYRRTKVDPEDISLQVSDDGQFRSVTTVPILFKFKPRSSVTIGFEPVRGRHFRLAFSKMAHLRLSEIVPREAPRVPMWELRGGHVQYPYYGGDTQLYAAHTMPREELAGSLTVSRDDLRDLTSHAEDGRLTWSVPEGSWTVLRIGYTSTGTTNHPATPEGGGLEVDKLSRQAVAKHFDAMVGRFTDRFDPNTLTHVLLDSWEAGTQNWTEGFADEFEKRRGYAITPYLPVLAGGRVVESYDVSERFLWDLRLTIAELIEENYWGATRTLAHEHGIRLMGEATGPGQYPYHPLKYQRQVDVPMGEFWVPDDTRRLDNKAASSAAHIYDKPLVAAEAFTGRSRAWDLDPFAMKAAGDLALTRGINWFILHSFVHQPYDAAPGFTLGKFGNHFQRHNTWYREAGSWFDYLTRTQYMLRQGRFVADIAYFAGEGVPNRLGFRADTGIPQGYDYDGVDAAAVGSMTVRDGRFILPSGMSYAVLVLPKRETMTPELASEVRRLIDAGGTVIGSKPNRSPSLRGYPTSDQRLREIVDDVWSRVITGPPTAHTLASIGLEPDFTCTAADDAEIKYIHRRTNETDIYFVANGTYRPEEAVCSFRVDGKAPELWYPDSGRIEKLVEYRPQGSRIEVPIQLDPAGSAFIVFRDVSPASDPVVSVTRDERRAAPSTYTLRAAQGGGVELLTSEAGQYVLEHASGRRDTVRVDNVAHPHRIEGPWSVRFDELIVEFDGLSDWAEHRNEEIRHFSGTATYRISFDLPETYSSGNRERYLDLGEVKNLASVRLNGQDLSTLWKEPFRLRVTDALKPGRNDLEVDVTNLWANRLIGDPPQEVEYRANGAIAEAPAWMGEAGGQRTFVTWQHFSPEDELLPSGLFGPVTIEAAERRSIAATEPNSSKTSKPNILFLFMDDWGRYAGVYDDSASVDPNDVIETPNIDRLAQEGVLFNNAFMGVPSCTPSRASVATGAYFWRAGRRANLKGGEWEGTPDPGDDLVGVGSVLQDAGYHVGRVFKTFDARWIPGPRYGGTKMSARYSLLAAEMGEEEAQHNVEQEIRSRFRRFLGDRGDSQPFFFSFGPVNAHRPWTQGSGEALWEIDPDDLKGKLPAFLPDVPVVREDFADYLGEVQALDAYVGYLVEELERAGALQTTMIVLTGDNGPPGFPRGKGNLYDFGVAAPLMVSWPEGIPHPNREVDDFVNLMDLAPTFLDAVGLKRPVTMDGRSIMPQLLADRSGTIDPARDFVVTGRERHVPSARAGNLPYPSRAIRTDDFLYIRNFKSDRSPMGDPPGDQPSFEDLRTDTFAGYHDLDASPTKAWMVTHREDPNVEPLFELGFGRRPAAELYDVRNDPDQMHNLAADPEYASTKEDLSRRLTAVMQEADDPRLDDAFDRPPYVEADASDHVMDTTAAAERDPPNVLFIAVDDLNTNLGAYGHPIVQTPNMDRLAEQGVRFDRAYTQHPHCLPSRTSLLTGLLPDRRIRNKNFHFRDFHPDIVTLPQFFRNEGYFTVRIGKMYHQGVPGHIGSSGPDDPASWDQVVNPAGRDVEDEYRITNVTDDRPLGSALSWRIDPGRDEEQTDGKVAGAAIELLESHRDEPFFLAVGFYRPHTPYVAPKKYFDLYPLADISAPPDPAGDLDDVPNIATIVNPPNWGLSRMARRRAIRAYYAATSFVDAQVGRVLDSLDELGLADNTIVVLWGDHGYLLGEHGQWLKRSLFEEAARVPLIISAPGMTRGEASERVVELLDLYPTLADLAGYDAPDHVQGKSLRVLLDDPAASWPHAAYTEVRRGQYFGESVRTERWRYIEWAEGEKGAELYDHASDPSELHNLAGEPRYADTVQRLRRLLEEVREEQSLAVE